jgi:hypothetical protein
MGAKKRQNKIWEYREMLLAWKRAGVITWAGYILGFPTDTPETIARDIEVIKRELPIDILEFFCLTPLPGSEDHQRLQAAAIAMDPDMNRYDLEHVCTAHATMSRETWQEVYRNAWRLYYTDSHVETVLRRAAACGLSTKKVVEAMTIFSGSSRIEGVHPLQFGFVRRKARTQRRHGMRIVNPVLFYPWRAFDFTRVALNWFVLVRRYRAIKRRVDADPNRARYRDTALTPAAEGREALVEVFADKIPVTHGAPVRQPAAA